MEVVINKYQGGKIYTIRSPHTDKYYIGSTVEKYLSSRLNGHNASYKQFLNDTRGKITSFEIIKLGDAYIELLEEYKCESKIQLHKREGELIREHKEHCINKCIAGRDRKSYNDDNKIELNEKQKYRDICNKDKKKQYYKDNYDLIKEKSKQYCENNKDALIEKKKEYYIRNKESIRRKHKEYYERTNQK